jgi:hypothetical protein
MGLMATPAGAASGTVGNLSVSVTPPTAGTSQAIYTISLVATDGIAAWNGTNGGISIVAPNGTDFCGASVGTLVDHSTPADSDTSNVDSNCGNPQNSFVIRLPHSVGAGDSITFVINDVTNPTAPGAYSLTLSTNNDSGQVSTGYSIVTGRVTGLTVASQPSVPGAKSTYVVTFVAAHGITAWNNSNGGISIVAPNGTNFCTVTRLTLVDTTNSIDSDTTGSIGYSCGNPRNTFTIRLPHSVGAGDSVTLTMGGVTNPSTANGADTLSLKTNNDPTTVTSAPYPIAPQGYWTVASDGGIFAFGTAQFAGSTGGKPLNAPIVGMASDGVTGGYWFVASDGGIFAFNAPFFGSMGGQHLDAPIVGMAATPDGGGYWSVASDGGIFSFGDAHFFGSMGGQPLNAPIVGMAATGDGGGYWFVAADGGIFSFGDALFQGSMGGKPLNAPIVGMATDPQTGGYWFVAADGGIFSFDAPFFGSMGGKRLNAPIVGMAQVPDQQGYDFVASDGGIFSFGAAGFEGSMGGHPLNQPIVGMAA